MANPYDEFMDPEKEYGAFMEEEPSTPNAENPEAAAPTGAQPQDTASVLQRGPSVSDRLSAGIAGLATGGLPGAVLGAASGPEAAETFREPGAARSAALGVSQGGTYGYADELGGLIGRFLAEGNPAVPGAAFQLSPEDTPEVAALKAEALVRQPTDYELVRDRMRAEAAAASGADPVAYGGGQLGGAIAASVLTRRLPGLRGPVAGLEGAAARSAALRAALRQGGIEGGFGGLGASDAEAPLGMLADTALGSAFGSLGGVGGEYLGRGLSALGSWAGRRAGNALSQGSESLEEGLRRWAQERALKAAGYIQSDFPDDPALLRRTMARGGEILDEPGLIRPGNSVAEIREKLEALSAEEGRNIGRYLDQADAAPFDPAFGYVPASFAPAPLASTARGDIARLARRDPSLVPQAGRIEGWADDLMAGEADRMAEGVPFTFREANRMKGRLQEFVYGSRSGDVPLNKELADDLQRALIREIDDQVTPLLGAEGVAGFQQARRRMGTFEDVLEKARRGEKREIGNQWMGLGDRMAAMQAAASEAAKTVDPTGIGSGLLSKFARGRADSAAAVGANVLSRNLPEATPEAMSAAGAAVGAGLGRVAGAELQDWLREVLASDPAAAARWAGALGAASAGGPEALAGTHYELGQQDPEYQARMRSAGGQQQ